MYPIRGFPQDYFLTAARPCVLGVLLMMGCCRYNRRCFHIGLPLVSAMLMLRPAQGFCCRMSRKRSKNRSLCVFTEGKCVTKYAEHGPRGGATKIHW